MLLYQCCYHMLNRKCSHFVDIFVICCTKLSFRQLPTQRETKFSSKWHFLSSVGKTHKDVYNYVNPTVTGLLSGTVGESNVRHRNGLTITGEFTLWHLNIVLHDCLFVVSTTAQKQGASCRIFISFHSFFSRAWQLHTRFLFLTPVLVKIVCWNDRITLILDRCFDSRCLHSAAFEVSVKY